jgi:L-ascorbate metabolism protein UlaG (beta-lactamase superfamily)
MIVKWLDHASFLVKVAGKNFYIDPYGGEYTEKADVILISHSHSDHCDLDKIKAILKPDTLIITSGDCARGLSGNVSVLSPGETKKVYDVSIEAVEAYNVKRFRSPGVPFHPQGTQIGFVIEAEGKRVYHAADTDYLQSMKGLKNIDLALLPIMGRAMMDIDEAVEATIIINPKIVIPMHRRGMNAQEFKAKVEARSGVKVLAIEPGSEVDP